jgi:hypothetical protein
MAFGQATVAAHFTPERSTLPREPLSMNHPRGLPSFEFGKPPKLQPQPKSQLQNWYLREQLKDLVGPAFQFR